MSAPGGDEPARGPKRWLIGEPLANHQLEGQLLPKHLALPIFASDPLSSVAYAPQELVMILAIGGLGFLAYGPGVALAVVVLMAVVVLSYRQLVRAYPSGGGDYEVARKNLGEKAGLVVGAALLVDYVMTVAVSVASGVDNIISAFPQLDGVRVELAVVFVVLLAAMNLRGVRESSRAFAIPTYLFIASIAVMIVTALVRIALGDPPIAESSEVGIQAESLTQAAFVLLILRAFASGCAALTGVEAIANGVPAFRRPKIRNAQQTLLLMGGTAIVLFSGLVAISLVGQVHYVDCTEFPDYSGCSGEGDPQRSLIAQMASATFGNFSVPFFIIQAATAAVLLLAANTAFNGFPLLGSVLSRDGYAPKSLSTRGDRLIFSNGVIALSITAIAILIVFRADLTTLVQLYIIGVFISFSLGQTGMVRHWIRALREGETPRAPILRSLAINLVGAAMTSSVLVIVTVTKFAYGAWIVFVVMPILWFLMLGVNRYYRDVDREIEVDATTTFGSKGDHAIVLVGRMQKPVLKALDYAIAARHESLEAVHISIDDAASERLEAEWQRMGIEVPLRIVASPYRDISMPLIKYIKAHRAEHGSEVVTVYTPQYVVGHWWETFLHNHKVRRIRHKLALVHGVVIALVPWLLDSSDLIYGRRSRPLPGQDRRGEPVRPVKRAPIAPANGAVSTVDAAEAAGSARRAAESEQPGGSGSSSGAARGGRSRGRKRRSSRGRR